MAHACRAGQSSTVRQASFGLHSLHCVLNPGLGKTEVFRVLNAGIWEKTEVFRVLNAGIWEKQRFLVSSMPDLGKTEVFSVLNAGLGKTLSS